MDKIEKELLVKIFCSNLEDKNIELEGLEEKIYKGLEEKGYVKKGKLTDMGRKAIKVVLAGGVFDIIHPGHIFTLSEAKKLGDVLVVSVARNSTVKIMKGREPLHDEKERVKMVSSLKMVDLALLGSEEDIFKTVIKVKPDIIVLGYDQKHNEKELEERGKKEGLNFKIVRLSSPIPNIKTSKILEMERF